MDIEMHLPREWRELEPEEKQQALEEDFVRYARDARSKRGEQRLRKIEQEVRLAQMRLSDEDAPMEPDAADERLPYWVYAPPTFAVLPQSPSLTYDFLISCVDVGFIVGHEIGADHWVRKATKKPSWWARLLSPMKAFAATAANAHVTLALDVMRSRRQAIGEVGADPPWLIEPRLRPKIVVAAWSVVTVDPEVTTPRETRLSLFANDMVKAGLAVGYSIAKDDWPPPQPSSDELRCLEEREKNLLEAGKRAARKYGITV